MIPYNKKFVPSARALRKNMTPEEKHLWYDFLKRLPITVKRQHNILDFVVDFYIANKKVVIEIDGIQHTMPEHRAADLYRDKKLSEWGITVLRYSNNDINRNFDSVADDILRALDLSASDLK